MRFGITARGIDGVDEIARAEELGYDFCWVPDTQLLMSNPWPVLALAARETSRIRLGTGLAIAGLRLAPVTANAIATINRLAPGRTFLGVGTGNTAMRTMGQPPMRVEPFAEYLRVVRALLAGDEVDYVLAGRRHPIRFQNHQLGHLDGPIPIHVGAFGPRAQAVAGELGDGLITGIPRGGTIPQALANVQRGAEQAGRSLDGFETYALANLLLLEPGETLSSPRALNQCGSAIMANVHYLVEVHKETGADPPDYVRPIWDDYLAFHLSRDAARRHQQLHQSHYTHLDPDEARFVTPEIIRNFCLAGQPDDIAEQLQRLEAEGLDGINFIFPTDQHQELIESVARLVMPRVGALTGGA